MKTHSGLKEWARLLQAEGNELGNNLMEYAEAWERDRAVLAPFAKEAVIWSEEDPSAYLLVSADPTDPPCESFIKYGDLMRAKERYFLA